ncbi:hypothetical protein BKA70DRAFT_1376230 [Coprinopsis sp. MPI-PUGE-AT-0042]|nr:hypothetical protein BKA70DRAFT_1376230 [Coprinopsis sp. MPI-PUGE-AT-0042]
MTRSYGTQQVCGPVEPVRLFEAQLRDVKPRRKGTKPKTRVELVPMSLRTPQSRKSETPGSRPSKRHKSTHDMSNYLKVPLDDQNSDWQDEESLFVPFDLPSLTRARIGNTPNDYMREWKATKERLYLDEILRADAPLSHMCSRCSLPSNNIWRCKDCFCSPLFCRECCNQAHQKDPFHRVEVWNATHFSPSWLWRSGLVLSLCADDRCNTASLDPNLVDALPSSGDTSFGAKPSFRIQGDVKVLTVVHTNGIHHLLVRFCTCHGGSDREPLDDDIQLLQANLYPSSHKDIRTAFTFAVMDNYLLDNLECYTSAFHYFSKLQRLTNEVFPKKVPDRYREGLRCGRQWRRIKELKRHGFGHTKGIPQSGDMALFCAACPQAGKNLKEGWRKEPNQWRHNVTLVADGNFTLVHRAQKTVDDVWLKNGESYMVGPVEYKKHIKDAPEKPTCHEHRAVEDRSKGSKGCDVTGVGAFACSRHGAFAPNSVVDFQKGERQVNMDYGLQGSIHSTGAIHAPRLNLLYDINCQYSVNLRQRFRTTETLNLPDDLVIAYGIGQFHVHGHQEKCFARYSPSFIDGIGKTAGEMLEPLWSTLNPAGKPTQTMTLAHRYEVLDAHIADNNWKKLINLGASISSAYEKNLTELETTRKAFDLLNETASRAQRALWQHQLSRAMKMRIENVKEMDILNVAMDKPPTRSKVQHNLMKCERDLNLELGVTSWISFGLKIQEAQLHLKAYIRNLPRLDLRTDNQELEKERRREQLQADAVQFLEDAQRLFPAVDFEDYQWFNPPDTNPSIDLEVDEDYQFDLESDNPFVDSIKDPEALDIPLPSAFQTLPASMKSARRKEISLRIAQANDSLEAIRTEIGHKSYLGFAAVKAADRSMRHHIRIYNQSTWALKQLEAPAKVTDRMDVQGDSAKSPYLEELYRVNWLKAKCLQDRATEQDILLRSEMGWIANFLEYKERQCVHWSSLPDLSEGHASYTLRQAETWRLLCLEAAKEFESALERGRKSQSSINQA